MRLFDTHAHYYDDKFDPDRAQVLAALPGKGVERVVCPGCDLPSSRQSLALAEQFPFLYFAAGLHPENLEGAGLGLYISDHFMKEMQGELILENGKNGLRVTVLIALSGSTVQENREREI